MIDIVGLLLLFTGVVLMFWTPIGGIAALALAIGILLRPGQKRRGSRYTSAGYSGDGPDFSGDGGGDGGGGD